MAIEVDAEQKQQLKVELNRWEKKFSLGSRAWSTVYQGSILCAAALSALAAAAIKIGYFKQHWGDDGAAICSSLAALLTSMVSTGGFSRKWRANRMARGKVQALQIDWANPTCDLNDVRAELKKILKEEDEGILGN